LRFHWVFGTGSHVRHLRLPVTTVPFSFLAPLAGGLLTDSLEGVLQYSHWALISLQVVDSSNIWDLNKIMNILPEKVL
jgi:hypothetical protein